MALATSPMRAHQSSDISNSGASQIIENSLQHDLALCLLLQLVVLKDGSLLGLPQSSILIATHFHSNRLQNLFNTHVAIPIAHGWQFFLLDQPRLGLDTRHVDFGNKSDYGRDGGILVGASNFELIKSTVVLCLKNHTIRFERPCNMKTVKP